MYQAIHEKTPRKTSYLAVGAVAVACCLVGAMTFSGSQAEAAQLQFSPVATQQRVGCRNVRAMASVDRRAMLGGLVGGLAALGAKTATAGPIEVIDDRKAVDNGLNIIYEARDLSLDQDTRDGMTQARKGLADTKKRASDAEKKLTEAGVFVDKAYWTEGRNILRRLVGTLRFDLAALADTKSGAAKKEAIATNKAFFADLEALDLAMYKKNKEVGQKAFTKTMASYKKAVAQYS
mmetsp:Transcript_10102/g.18410  ORF Transcript_10102/g.18410 Transcript_10102/m.18410 type:complete len:235 (-) Transcript_10102:459-1163(-)|eukprot:CAMPEP_0197515784 /NCGR_PEP_ID=MMETSP1318-20131121/798_1 /TAXON_ID=552666 /ORGANISM="Partenskyella glossopodia, Strain RCC365" /LENGTH=234 /DNA_ID=CAMNT_0043064241 /DNA_START=61 /DNA_END=765 /DNA_ORIENTATION=+